jgi:predicted enzyme related to lactoylglutathione lyase
MTAAAVLYVKDLATMRAFYETCFAMSAQLLDEQGLCVLSSKEWELSLVRIPESLAVGITITDPPQRRQGSPLKLAFEVVDIEAAESMITAAGGQIDADGSAFEFQSRRHRDFLDPEGNIAQLRQRLLV